MRYALNESNKNCVQNSGNITEVLYLSHFTFADSGSEHFFTLLLIIEFYELYLFYIQIKWN